LLLASTAIAQVPPRDQPPAHVEAAMLEAQLTSEIAAEGLTVARAMKLAMFQEKRGAAAEAEATLLGARKLFPIDRPLATALAGHYVRQGKSARAMEVLEEQARLTPDDRNLYYMIATHYEELVRKGAGPDDEKRAYIMKGIAAVDRAITLDPASSEALAYKNILLRHQARLEPDPATQRMLTEQADALRTQAIELQKQRATPGAGGAPSIDPSGPPPPPPPPPPTRPPCDRGVLATMQAPVRVGGNIQAPTKLRDVRPVYPIDAQVAKIQGVVIVEAIIDESGRVAQACVLRSIPLLDDPALNAVAQWEFTPTLLNGAPVPVIMTVTVNFTLQ
jgi:TonB family protein